MASHPARIVLLTLLFLTVTAAAAAQVEFHSNVLVRLGNAEIDVSSLQTEVEWIKITPDNMTMDDLTFNVSSTNDIDITMEIYKREAISGGTVAQFVADADSGTATFTFHNLFPGQTYNVSRNDTPILTKEISGNTLTFSSSTWSPHMFTVQMLISGGLSALQNTITTALGETGTSSILLTNPKDTTDTYTLTVTPSMDSGSAAVTLDTGDEEGDTVTVTVDGEDTRALTLNAQGSSCSSSTCTGSATIVADSDTTDEHYTEEVNIIVRRNPRIHGSPGLTWHYILIIAVLGGLIILLRDKKTL